MGLYEIGTLRSIGGISMAEKNQTEKKVADQRKIVCKGPKEKDTGVAALRIQTGIKKDQQLDIYNGQTLVVERDVSKEVADKLLQMESWKFEEVK